MEPILKLSAREKNILYILTVIVAGALLFNLVIEPLIKRWRDIDSETILVKIKLQKAISVLSNKNKTDEEYSAYLKRLKPRGSSEQETTFILNELETIARASDLKIVNMRPKPVKDMDYYKRYIVDIETESNMKSLMMFIYKVKNSPQLIKIDRLSLNTKSSQQGLLIKASMNISKISID